MERNYADEETIASYVSLPAMIQGKYAASAQL